MAKDKTHADPIKSERGCYKRGDIVEIFEDGACKEPVAPTSPFVIVKVTGITKAQAEKCIQAHLTAQTTQQRFYTEDWNKRQLSNDLCGFISSPTTIANGVDDKGKSWVMLQGEMMLPVKRRLYNIDYTLLSPTIINKLQTDKEITVTVTQVKNFIRNKVTNTLG